MKYKSLAKLCRIAYKIDFRIIQELEKIGFKKENITIIDKSPLKCFIAKTGIRQYVVFKGTSTIEEAFIDANVLSIKTKHGKVHKGIWRASVELFKQLNKHLDSELYIYLTGHSLGAGMAFYVSDMLFLSNYKKIKEVVGFGVPNLGDKNYKNWCLENQNFHKIKFQNNLDIVGNVPRKFKDISSKLYYFDRKNRLHEDPTNFYLLQDKIICYMTMRYIELYKDHRIDSYVKNLENIDI